MGLLGYPSGIICFLAFGEAACVLWLQIKPLSLKLATQHLQSFLLALTSACSFFLIQMHLHPYPEILITTPIPPGTLTCL